MLMTLFTIIALTSTAGATEARHSGTIVGLHEHPARIIMDEIVAWTGPDSGRVRRTIQVTPDTSIQVVQRTDTWGSSRTSKPGFEESAVDASALRVGDFVTVTVRNAGGAVAVAMEIVRPEP